MRGKALLLGSVSSIATIAVAVSAADAQSVSPGANGYTFSVQGGALFSAPDPTLSDKAGEKTGASGFSGVSTLKDLPTDVGYNAAFSFGKKLDGNWDIAFGASMNRMLENSGSLSFSGSSGSGGSGSGAHFSSFNGITTETTNFGFETGDFEVGFTPHLDNGLNVRLFGGIRALHFNNGIDKAGIGQTSGFSGSSSFNYQISGDESISSDFLGAGPRIGLSAAKRFDSSNFGLSGSLAGAAIFGRQTDTVKVLATATGSGAPTGGGSSSFSTTENKTVVDVQGSLGIDYYLDDASALTVGYQAEELFNVGPVFDSSSTQQTNKLVSGPFVKFTGSF